MSNPKVRRDGLLLEELPTELLVYDQRSHRAHCLNAPAAAVFRAADGSRDVAGIARAASERLGATLTEDLVRVALQDLDTHSLLDTPLPLVPSGPSRRNVVIAGAAAALIPLVLAITAPTPAFAASFGSSTANPAPSLGLSFGTGGGF